MMKNVPRRGSIKHPNTPIHIIAQLQIPLVVVLLPPLHFPLLRRIDMARRDTAINPRYPRKRSSATVKWETNDSVECAALEELRAFGAVDAFDVDGLRAGGPGGGTVGDCEAV